QLQVGEVAMSIITYGELMYGASKSQHPKKTMGLVDRLAELIVPLPLPTKAGKFYGELRCLLEKQGKPIGNNDLWIAAHNMSLGTTLVTHNLKEFSRIKNLKCESWVKAPASG
ncbi:MAG: type II toxin-antitoxin system VapC family toxin, partial [Coxiellaceae bacterium]|nr:type II toxin-antitoxin system VapC family toxin [Coxiellaceae bacterium]